MNAKRTEGFPAELVPLVLIGPVGAWAMLAAKDHENIWLSAILSLIAIAVVMLWYRYGDDRYDLDRAGDCAYYLGLCYTLGSLIYTLAHHFGAEGQGGEAVAVIPAFGVALPSTLGGVIARIYLQACAAQRDEGDEISTEPLTPERMRNLYGDQLALAAQAIARELRTTTGTFAQLNRAAFQQADQMARRGAEAGERAGRTIDAAFHKTEQEASRLATAVQRLNSAVSMNARTLDESSRSVQQSIREATQALEACALSLSQQIGQFEAALTTVAEALERQEHGSTAQDAARPEAVRREILRLPGRRDGRSAGE